MSEISLEQIGKNSIEAKKMLGKLTTNEKNTMLNKIADALIENSKKIITANVIDMENGKKNNMPKGILDRLFLDESRILGMADGLRQVAQINDPIGEVTDMSKRPNGIIIGKRRVPMGVVGIIYEARPNVTSDAFALCFKSSNVTILKGGSDCINSNIAMCYLSPIILTSASNVTPYLSRTVCWTSLIKSS